MSKKLRAIKEILEAQGTLNERFESLKGKIETDGLDKLSDEERSEMENYQAELMKLIAEERMARSTEVFTQNQVARMANVVPGDTADISKKEVRNLANASLGRAMSLMAQGKSIDGLEGELNQYGKRQASLQGIEHTDTSFVMPMEVGKVTEERGQTVTGQTTTAGDQGGTYVPTEIAPFIEALWSKTFLSTVGATRFTNLIGNQKFPVQKTKPTVQELTEIEAIDDDEILWGQIEMTPKRRGNSIPISRLLMIQGSIDTQSFVTGQLATAMAHKMDLDALVQLLAIASPQLISLGTNGAALDWAKVVALETAIAAADADVAGLHYLTNSKVRGSLKTTKKDAGSGIFLMENGELNGYPVAVSNYLPSNLVKGSSGAVCSPLFYGNFADLYVGMWGGLVFDIERKPKTDLSEFTVNAYWDTKIARAESFAVYKDVLTA
jgi:HK97 family phage major capsid protein